MNTKIFVQDRASKPHHRELTGRVALAHAHRLLVDAPGAEIVCHAFEFAGRAYVMSTRTRFEPSVRGDADKRNIRILEVTPAPAGVTLRTVVEAPRARRTASSRVPAPTSRQH